MARRKASTATGQGDSVEDKIVREAQKRFNRCETWESTARKRYIEDIKFCNGDADNFWQWPQAIRDARGWGTDTERPCLTINKTRQHCLQIQNDARQNKTSIKVKPTGNGATFEAAQVLEGIMRHIEYVSDADSAYSTATRFQVQGGIGYWRVTTDYAGPDTFDQEIFIRRIKDPLSVFVDPDFQEADGSDMRFAFVFEDMPKDQFDEQYPAYKDKYGSALNSGDGWVTEDHVRIAEYFRRVEKKDRIYVVPDASGKDRLLKASEMPKEFIDTLESVDSPRYQARDIVDSKVEWFLIIGNEIAEQREWPGRYIPIVRVPGEETVIDGELDRKGHVRALKDPQRMYNYNASSQVEFGALQSKIPFTGSAESIEGYETFWRTANTQNYSILPFNAYDADGRPLAPPQRATPPTTAPAYQVGMENAANDMMLVSGQYQADVGAPSNERSGVAIQQRQRQGENATYHFIDHLAMAIRFTGKIIIDLVPKIYDTRRVIKIMGEDGTDSEVTVDPNAQAAYIKTQKQVGEATEQVLFNPNVGRYDVMSDVGPAYATRRQEAFNAFSQIVSQNQELVSVIGDLMFKNADFPGADEISERLKRMVPPQALGDGPTPQMQQLMQQNQALQQMLQAMSEKLRSKGSEEQKRSDDTVIEAYRAETERLKIVAPSMTPEEFMLEKIRLAHEIMATPLPPTGEQQLLNAPQPQNMAAA